MLLLAAVTDIASIHTHLSNSHITYHIMYRMKTKGVPVDIYSLGLCKFVRGKTLPSFHSETVTLLFLFRSFDQRRFLELAGIV